MLLGTLLRDTKEGPKLLSLELAGIASPACGYGGRADTHIGPSPPGAIQFYVWYEYVWGGVPLWACMAGMSRSQRSAQAEAAPRHPRFLPTL